jgi:hypothetical protein
MSEVVDLYIVTHVHGLPPAYVGSDANTAQHYGSLAGNPYTVYQIPAVVIHQGKKRLP